MMNNFFKEKIGMSKRHDDSGYVQTSYKITNVTVETIFYAHILENMTHIERL